jgi:hypothetical protein
MTTGITCETKAEGRAYRRVIRDEMREKDPWGRVFLSSLPRKQIHNETPQQNVFEKQERVLIFQEGKTPFNGILVPSWASSFSLRKSLSFYGGIRWKTHSLESMATEKGREDEDIGFIPSSHLFFLSSVSLTTTLAQRNMCLLFSSCLFVSFLFLCLSCFFRRLLIFVTSNQRETRMERDFSPTRRVVHSFNVFANLCVSRGGDFLFSRTWPVFWRQEQNDKIFQRRLQTHSPGFNDMRFLGLVVRQCVWGR